MENSQDYVYGQMVYKGTRQTYNPICDVTIRKNEYINTLKKKKTLVWLFLICYSAGH